MRRSAARLASNTAGWLSRKLVFCTAMGLSVLLASPPARADFTAGSYLCVIQQTAGINEGNGQHYAGPLNLAERHQQLLLEVRHFERDPMTREFCGSVRGGGGNSEPVRV